VQAFEAAVAIWNDSDQHLEPSLIRTLRKGSRPFNRAAAAYAMQMVCSQKTILALEQAFRNKSEHARVRGEAAEALAHCHRKESHDVLLAGLLDPSKEVRFWCAFALGEMGDRRAIPTLKRIVATDKRIVKGWYSVAKEAADFVLLEKDLSFPVVNLFSHVDSLEQLEIDKKFIVAANTEVKDVHDGVYYTMLKEGNGRQVSVNDTVTAYYKGYLLKDGSVFDQTKDKPAIFPLKRLIMGWQIGVPLCKVGGKIKIIIPSNLAYSIRTRAAKIPPNSVLVFEIEVVDAKAPQ